MTDVEDPIARIRARQAQRQDERLKLRNRLLQLDREQEDDAVALRVLAEMYPHGFGTNPEPRVGIDPKPFLMPTAQTPVAAMQNSGNSMKVKDMLLAILRDSPEGLTAKQIKGKAQIKYRTDINPNTLTVSLVRASKAKNGEPAKVRCRGRVWHYIEQPEVPNVRAPELALNGKVIMGE